MSDAAAVTALSCSLEHLLEYSARLEGQRAALASFSAWLISYPDFQEPDSGCHSASSLLLLTIPSENHHNFSKFQGLEAFQKTTLQLNMKV